MYQKLPDSGIDDMINLRYLNEPCILQNLDLRFTSGLP